MTIPGISEELHMDFNPCWMIPGFGAGSSGNAPLEKDWDGGWKDRHWEWKRAGWDQKPGKIPPWNIPEAPSEFQQLSLDLGSGSQPGIPAGTETPNAALGSF